MPKILIADMKPGRNVSTTLLVQEKELRKARNGKPFLSLRLSDKSGELVGRVWDGAEDTASVIPCKGVVALEGRVELFREELQLNIQNISPVASSDIDPGDFLPTCPHGTDILFQELKQTLGSIQRKPLQQLVKHLTGDARLMEKFKKAPAAKSMHHAYLGGLLEHTLGVCKLALAISDHYGPLDRDLLLMGAFLHDMGKVDEFDYEWFIDYSHAGRLLGHMVLGVEILEEKIRNMKHFPSREALLLKHMVLSHHGASELGAVRLPMTREAIALHFADDLDAKMNSISRILNDKKAGDDVWTAYQSLFERYFLRGLPSEGDSPAPPGKSHDGDTDDFIQLNLWSSRKND